MPTLYHYAHCPYCVRVRMAFGFLQIPYQTKLVEYHDEKTPMDLIGKKMLPVVVDDYGKAIPESLDIIALFDTKNYFKVNELKGTKEFTEVEALITSLGKAVHALAMPHWIYTKEFTPAARSYFQIKKEVSKGPFLQLIKNRAQYEADLKPLLTTLEHNISNFYKSNTLGLFDIMIASQLWGLYVVPEFQFSTSVHSYLQRVKHFSHFNYQQDLWK